MWGKVWLNEIEVGYMPVCCMLVSFLYCLPVNYLCTSNENYVLTLIATKTQFKSVFVRILAVVF